MKDLKMRLNNQIKSLQVLLQHYEKYWSRICYLENSIQQDELIRSSVPRVLDSSSYEFKNVTQLEVITLFLSMKMLLLIPYLMTRMLKLVILKKDLNLIKMN